jgi:hypothetical protein
MLIGIRAVMMVQTRAEKCIYGVTSMTLDVELATKEVLNCSQVCLVDPAIPEFVEFWITLPFTRTSTVLVVP